MYTASTESPVRTTFLPSGTHLPLVVTPDGRAETARSLQALLALVNGERARIDAQLGEHGGILFRGFDITSTEEFETAARAIDQHLLNYTEGQSQRRMIGNKIYNSTDYPARFDIVMHNELSYAHEPPKRILFFCDTPPGYHGETPIVDCRRILDLMNPGLRERFAERQIRYVKYMHGGSGFGKSWQGHFETEDRAVVEDYLQRGAVDFEWLPDGGLRTSQVRPAIITHPDTGEEVWFNQATLWHVSNLGEEGRVLRQRTAVDRLPTNAYFGDGGTIPDEDLNEIRQLMWRESVVFPWQRSDLLVLDNILVAHGRRAYSGPRKILVAMA
jgi:alpha-ketoglutarate-dependent taurine dioxygenase